MSKEFEALLYEKLPENKVRCQLCAHNCLIAEGKRGICKVRENRAGVLYSLTYGRLIAAHVDPIEKKPLFHFYPGSRSFSVASPGCNFDCQWCQNWEISQGDSAAAAARCPYTPAKDVVSSALHGGCRSISYTYTEPTVFFEYSQDVGRLAREAGLKNVYVSNGYMSPETISLLRDWLDAANVDVKAFSDEVYRKHIGARLQPVLEACVRLKEAGVWLEITTLLIPGLNDDEAQLRGLTRFIARELGQDIPWHVSRYFPQYKYQDAEVTSLASIENALEIGKEEGLKYTYAGNVAGSADTLCPQCGATLIERSGMSVFSNRIKAPGLCPECGAVIAGVGLAASEASLG
ncbi:MAG TPA: AmmeMemoRadiSam system radical SAM enzyme [Anaerolineaceae bacterium]|jgi:pyruvate formate lyase activating enzyme|nr:AmmeMemoRadiSam system radical SAM enzyme [Anaerolineaceae bacterium]